MIRLHGPPRVNLCLQSLASSELSRLGVEHLLVRGDALRLKPTDPLELPRLQRDTFFCERDSLQGGLKVHVLACQRRRRDPKEDLRLLHCQLVFGRIDPDQEFPLLHDSAVLKRRRNVHDSP